MKIKTRRYYIYYSLKVLTFLVSLMPLRIGLFLANFLGKAAFKFGGKYSETAVTNIKKFTGKNEEESISVARKVFINCAKNGAEWVKFNNLPEKKLDTIITEFQGKEHLDSTLRDGNGAIALTSHYGNWEFLGIYLRHLNYTGKVIGRRIYFHKYDKFVNRMRKRFDVHVIYRDESPKKMIRVLKQGHVLGVVPDQDVDSIEGVFVDFFGAKAYTPTAPVKLAMATGAKIVPMFDVRNKDNTHKIIAEAPIEVKRTGDTEEDVKRYTQMWSNVVEKYIREYPDQWVWIHDRWKTQPENKTRCAEAQLTK